MRLTCGHGRPGISRRRSRNRPRHLPLPLFCWRAFLSIPSLPPGLLLRSGLPALFSLAAQARPSRPHFLRVIPWHGRAQGNTQPNDPQPHCILGPQPPGPTCQNNGTIPLAFSTVVPPRARAGVRTGSSDWVRRISMVGTWRQIRGSPG